MFDKLASEEQRYQELANLLGTSAVQNDSSEYRKHAKALSELEPLVEKFREFKAVFPCVTPKAACGLLEVAPRVCSGRLLR